jgi:predicted PurR-regulated permease PerM
MARDRESAPFSDLRALIALFLLALALYVGKPFIVPLVLAILLTFVLTPVVSTIQRRGLPRVPSVLLTVLLTFVVFAAGGWIVGIQVRELAQDLQTHRTEIARKIADLRQSVRTMFPRLREFVSEVTNDSSRGAPEPRASEQPRTVVVQTEESSSFERILGIVGPVFAPLAQAGLVIVLIIFMLINREDLRNRAISILGHGRLTGTTRVFVDSAQRLSRFLLTQLLINVGFGFLLSIGLLLMNVPYAFLWGFLAAVLRFVPYIGTWVALAFPLLVSFAVSPGWTQPLLVIALFATLELITANVIEPLLFGHGTGVSPVALLVAAAFWTWIWGPIGLVLSTPMTVCLAVLGQHVPSLRFFALLLGEKPALEPHVSYYQRLLAGDEEEARQVASEYARSHSEDNVYDEVLLPALMRARQDRVHGHLSAADEEFILHATEDILNELARFWDIPSGAATATVAASLQSSPKTAHGHSKRLAGAAQKSSSAASLGQEAGPVASDQPPDQSESPRRATLILGCPAHHEAEELSLRMLDRLLRADGITIEALSTRTVPSEVEARIESEKPALVMIAILPPGGVEQARYLCKRLRKRASELPIVVGYWGRERNYDKILGRMRSAGASYVTTSLRQSRSQVRALLTPPAPTTSGSEALSRAHAPHHAHFVKEVHA